MRPPWDVVWLSDIPWSGLWQRPQQLATRFPEDTRILFVEPWTLGARPAWSKEEVAPRIERVSFPFLPLHARNSGQRRLAYRLGSSGVATSLLFGAQRAWAARWRGFGRRGARRLVLAQNFLATPFLDAWHPDRIVYDMIDAPLHFAPVPPRLVPQWERLVSRADRVVVTSGALASLARAGGAANPLLIGNGVEASRFDPERVAPAALPGAADAPALGYVGSLHSWFDLDLVAALAAAMPEARVVLVGPAPPETAAALERLSSTRPNFFWLGPRPYSEVPSIVRAFRVGLIPFRRTPLTEAVNPVKLYEYAAAGVPTVTTRFSDEVDAWGAEAVVADGVEAFTAACRRAASTPADVAALRAFAKRNDWDSIAARFVAACLEEAA
ncbi:MAG TPA: glycosyltransferase [Candidatus Eisenbacteria bacterium]|nr:glycosyltransferase [Candidatus Eisenbacteria bacterium]